MCERHDTPLPLGECGLCDAEAAIARVMASIRDTESTMQVEIQERADMPGAWTVEAIGSDGEIYQAVFIGPDAEGRAREYARVKYNRE